MFPLIPIHPVPLYWVCELSFGQGHLRDEKFFEFQDMLLVQ